MSAKKIESLKTDLCCDHDGRVGSMFDEYLEIREAMDQYFRDHGFEVKDYDTTEAQS